MKKNYPKKLLSFTIVFLLTFLGLWAQDDFALRINAGGSEINYNNDTYLADQYFDTGNTLDRPQTGLSEPYQTFRFSRSQVMGYDISLPNGEYTVNLHFAELWFGATDGGEGGAGKRVFDVSLEGQLAEDNLDIFDEVGAETMLIKTHRVTVTDGVLNIDLDSRDAVGGERHPVINAIEILGEQAPQEIAIEGYIAEISPISGDSGTYSVGLNNGDQIRKWENDQYVYAIGVETTNGVQSVRYEYTNAAGTTETAVANSFGGISYVSVLTENIGYVPIEFGAGTYTITATPYLEANQGGEAGTPITIAFEIIDSCQEVSFEVVNATDCDPNGGYAILRDEARNFNIYYEYSDMRNMWEFDEELSTLVARNLYAGTYTIDYYSDYGCTSKSFTIGTDNCEEPNDFALRVNTGGSEVDYNGETFMADTYFDTGNTLDRPQTGLPEPYQKFRFSRSQQMSYAIPIPDGKYTVNLHFAELWFGATGGGLSGAGRRVFDVSIEGQLAEDNLDIFAEVGAETMLVKTHTVTVTDGMLEIEFDSRDAVGGERHPVINAIEVLGIATNPDIAIERFVVVRSPRSGDSGPGAANLNDGDQIRYWEYDQWIYLVGVEVESGIQSVFLEYTNAEGITETKVSNTREGVGNGAYISPSIEVGIYTITATPYSEADQGGVTGTPVTISYEIIEDLVISELYAVRSSGGASTIFEEITYEPSGVYFDGEDHYTSVDGEIFSGIAPIISSNVKSLNFGIDGPEGNFEEVVLHGEFPVLNIDEIGTYDIYILHHIQKKI